jgi:Xaa-Pro aminopeptidase
MLPMLIRVSLATALLLTILPARTIAAGDAIPPAKPFAPEVYKERRAKVMKAMAGGIAVIYARGEEDPDGYRQDSDFFYLTGLNEEGAVLVLSPEERLTKERLFLKPRNPDDEAWTGGRPDINEALRQSTGIDHIYRTGSLGAAMIGLLQTTSTLLLISDPGGIDAPTTPEMELYGKLASKIPGVSIKNRIDILQALRSVKEPRELEYMERAIAATVAAQHAAAHAIRPGVEENWVAGLIDLEFKRGGAVRPGFASIVGSGPNSTILHYPEHARTIQDGDLVVVDIGSDYGHYSADITRTYPANGRFTPEQRTVYEVVLHAQQACMDMIRPGVYFEDVHKRAEDVIRAAGYRDYFIHGVGHYVGLDVHDAGLYKKPLQAGMVITVEPGIYIREKSLGVRIEDQVLVTPKGYRLLTSALPRDPEAVERMMSAE